MKMAMRLDKSQVKSTYKWTSGSGTWNRDLAIMAGYKKFDVMVVGASGGSSGQAGSSTYYGIMYPSGGGGGGSRLVSGVLSSLPAKPAYAVGSKGANGANVGPQLNATVRSGTGGRGGTSSFGGVASAVGGYGGVGGYVRYGSTAALNPCTGGAGGNYEYALGPGTWSSSTRIGRGGSGWEVGAMRVDVDHDGDGEVLQPAAPGFGGAEGSDTPWGAGDPFRAPGEAVRSTYYSGGGGGANIAPLQGGAADYYGSGSGADSGGVVFLKVS